MKMYYLFLTLFAYTLWAGCGGKNDTVTILGDLENVEDSTTITLYEVKNRVYVSQVSDTVIDGKFRITLADSSGQARQMVISARGEGFPPTSLPLWIAPGETVRITGKDKMLRNWSVRSNIPQQKELNNYNSLTRDYSYPAQLVMREAYAYFDSIQKSPERGRGFRVKIDSLYAISDSLNDLILKAEVDLLAEKKTYSDVWMDKLNHHSMGLRFGPVPELYVAKMKELYAGMPEEQKNTALGRSIYLSLNPPKVVGEGDDMADADMWDTDGNLLRLANFKGKYILLDFWSGGCGPCIMSIPEMKEISATYNDELTVVSISSDSKEVWTEVSAKEGVTWINLNDFKGEDGIKIHYGVRGIPHYVLISPEGKVITSWGGYGKGSLKAKMKELLGH